MRTLVLAFVLAACVTMGAVAAPPAAGESGDGEVSPALVAELTAHLSDRGSLSETAFSLVEDLREVANLEGFQLQLSMSKGTLSASLRARFTFASLAELSAWKGSEDVQKLLSSLRQASEEQPRLDVHGRLASE